MKRMLLQPTAKRNIRPIRVRPSDHGREMTLEEFERTIDEPGCRFELVRGRIARDFEPVLVVEVIAEGDPKKGLRAQRRTLSSSSVDHGILDPGSSP